MASYGSRQDESIIEEQIARFERRHSINRRKCSWRTTCSVAKRVLRAFPDVVRTHCKSNPRSAKAELKKFRYDRYPKATAMFTCDGEDQRTEEEQLTARRRKDSRKRWQLVFPPERLRPEELNDFSSFRHRFYNSRREQIISAFSSHPQIKIFDIRPAPIDPAVQNYFMKTLASYPHFPELVYHGSTMTSMTNILRYGLMIPNQHHPLFSDAPIIRSRNGQAYGAGIYCTQRAVCALENLHRTNTILVCAALPVRRRQSTAFEHSFGDILLLKDESRIIPLFLLDVQYLQHAHPNHPWYDYQKTLAGRRKKAERRTDASISRSYLRKVLDQINGETRREMFKFKDEWINWELDQ